MSYAELAKHAAAGSLLDLSRLEEAAENEGGNPDALFLLGELYDDPSPLNSKLVSDKAEARRYYLRAAELGHCHAQLFVGNMFDYGEGGEKDLEKARYWYATAAARGVRDAQMHFGRMLELGRGGYENKEEAAEWYLRAVKQGDEKAATNLASMHLGAELANSDAGFALKLLQFSAEKLDGIAHLHLGSIHHGGKIVEQHGGKALFHYFVATFLLPHGPNYDTAINCREEILEQHPNMRTQFEEMALAYVSEHGGQLPP